MTTTLRPAAPEERHEDGGRSREFTVCVNGRPVGRLLLATDRRLGPATGRITSLRVEPADQRRGRGAVAALAAEEVLRGWGCRRVRARVPADAVHALRLAAALGYTERNRAMVKRLAAAVPPLPPGSEARAMDETDYARWFERTRAGYIGMWEADGVPHGSAVAIADHDCAEALPDGHRTADTALRVLTHRSAEVGWIWVRVRPAGPGGTPWVYLVETAPEHRGEGHGRTLMLIAERECLAAGAEELGLNVFAGNIPATRLYESLGYRPRSYEMTKSLD